MIEQLQQEMRRVGEEMSKAWAAPQMSPQQWENYQQNRRRIDESIQSRHFKNAEAWSAMIWDTVELRYFIAKRRCTLAWFGLSDEPPTLYRYVLKDQPAQLGVTIIVAFRDALTAIDPRQEIDALYAPDCAEVFRAHTNPATAVARWMAKRTAAGDPFVPGEKRYASLLDAAAPGEFQQLRDLMYPTKEALKTAKAAKRLWNNPQEDVRETLAMLRARLKAGDRGSHFCRCSACGQLIIGGEQKERQS